MTIDVLLRNVVAKRAGHRCEFPGCQKTDCSPHHAAGRGRAVKHNPDTCVNLCNDHHVYGPVSAHGTPDLFKKIMVESGIRSAEWFDEMLILKSSYSKTNMDEYWKCRLENELRGIAA